MRIKELHLRNIASIQSADIDFEKGLNDAVTGDPASVFLISGDTGSGKSVILDGISMALYKTTPRLEGVVNQKQNEFLNADGQSVRINSIEQYTRLGISPGTECYSEVVFEGNDGATYAAKLTLGCYLSNKNKVTGDRSVKYKTPEWTVRREGGEWVTSVTDVQNIIAKAVGLTFDQFSRMSMLAQGQFAAFLTGDREERANILESLTNTELFSEYGNAVRKIAQRYQEKEKGLKKEFELETAHTLPGDVRTSKKEELAAKKSEKESVERQKEGLEVRLKHLETVYDKSAVLAEKQIREKALIDVLESDDYKKKKRLGQDWEATQTERHNLSSLRMHRRNYENDLAESVLCRERFGKLCSDLNVRQTESDKLAESVAELKRMVEAESGMAGLYSKSGEVIQNIGRYVKLGEDTVTVGRQKDAALGRRESLAAALAEADSQLREASEVLQVRQTEIDRLISERERMNISQVNEELTRVSERKSALDKTEGLVMALQQARGNIRQEAEAIEDQAAGLAGFESEYNYAADVYNAARAAHDIASARYTTMNASVEDTLAGLRARLVSEGTETCPLCGQHIEKILLEDDFRELLAPLEQEKSQAKEAMNAAEETMKAASASYERHKGEVAVRENTLKKLKNDAEKLNIDLISALEKVALEPDDNLDAMLVKVRDNIEQTDELLAKLREVQDSYSACQKAINDLENASKPLRDIRDNKDKLRNDVIRENDANELEINMKTERLREILNEREALEEQIDGDAGILYPDWNQRCHEVCETLRKESERYNGLCRELATAHQESIKASGIVGQLDAVRVDILTRCPDWSSEYGTERFATNDIAKEWNMLLGSVNRVLGRMEQTRSHMSDCEAVLEEYCLRTGKTEAYLDEIQSYAEDIRKINEFVRNTDGELKSCEDAIAAAEAEIEEAMSELGLDPADELPILEDLRRSLSEVGGNLVSLISEIATIEAVLRADDENSRKVDDLKVALEAASAVKAKWDAMDKYFGGNKFRNLVQTYILRPLLNNANIYLERITDRYKLVCSEENAQLSILVLDRYNKDQVRSVTVLSGGERFMISLALSLALSSLNRPDLNVDILFIDEGFGTLDEKTLDSVMATLERLQEIAGQSDRRVGIISHREELKERITVQIEVEKKGEGRSEVKMRSKYA